MTKRNSNDDDYENSIRMNKDDAIKDDANKDDANMIRSHLTMYNVHCSWLNVIYKSQNSKANFKYTMTMQFVDAPIL